MTVTSEIVYPDDVFGVNWNPFERDEYLAACKNGIIYLCNMNQGAKPLKSFEGHELRVFNVVFNT